MPCSFVVAANTVPCGVIKTTTTIANGALFTSTTCPLMFTTLGDGLVTGFVAGVSPSGRGSNEDRCCGLALGVGAGVDSGVALDSTAGCPGALSGVAAGVPCAAGSVTSGDGEDAALVTASAGETLGCATGFATGAGPVVIPRICSSSPSSEPFIWR